MRRSANDAVRSRPEAASLVVSRAPDLVALVQRSCSPSWSVEARGDWRRIDKASGGLDVGIVVLDDDVVPEEERSDLIANLRTWFPHAMIIYIAGKHDAAVERMARAGGVLSYTSKPVDVARLESLLRGLSHRRLESSPTIRH
jgi:DNA-binding NtrC family response regulator